jgi:hypothetical protein
MLTDRSTGPTVSDLLGEKMLEGPRLPTPRDPLSAAVLSALGGPPGCLGPIPPVGRADALFDDDLQLALYCCHALHYEESPGLVEAEPGLSAEVLFGAAGFLLIEERFAAHLINAWSSASSSLLPARQ